MSLTNTRVKLASRPVGLPQPANFDIETIEVPSLEDGQVLVKISFISLDPAMRGWMNEGRSYIKPIAIGDVFRAGVAGQIAESKSPAFAVGDYVTGSLGVQQYAVVGAGATDPRSPEYLVKVDPSIVPLEAYLATLGMPGMTAYFGLLDTGQPKAGETVVVSGAAGAVGSVVGQIARLKGCRVVGIAGDQEKCDYCVQTLGFDACINYKTDNVRQALRAACPQGIDVYFDNVGGEILDLVLEQIRLKARIVICGAISQYNSTTGVRGPANYLSLLMNRARMEGIVVFDNAANYGTAAREMAGWIKEGKLHSPKIQVEHGVKNFLPALLKLFSGENFGKLVLVP
ncbi:NADP-dependent oxidoreductase [Hymenobacter siberiensis]|uniref:NADP-dependent oxidoreductase n=1 Tax=Hymenobacter siberiensis TaxID=2848396 RepID=UPI001C1E672B|nr:NADP-dependent oxidoreductase [Hymenobacter siberiensis]MBU6121060.1 NADP-dependent oxidoreductase [Hymenobacter siberiensis]